MKPFHSLYQPKKFSALSVVRGISLGATIALLASFQPIASAQSSFGNDTGEFQNNELNTFGGGTFQNFNPIDLYHRANFSKKSLDVFNEESEDSLNNAADEFKRQQQERLQQSAPESSDNELTQ